MSNTLKIFFLLVSSLVVLFIYYEYANFISFPVYEDRNNGLSRSAYVTSFFYYPGKDQRHPIAEYQRRFSRFSSIFINETSIYIFINDAGFKVLEPKETERMHVIRKYDDAFEVCNLSQYKDKYVKIAKKYNRWNYFISENLGAIWNSKICLVDEINKLHKYEYVFWIDFGAFKTTNYTGVTVPYQPRIDKIFSKHRKFLLGINIYKKLARGMDQVPMEQFDIGFSNVIVATFFGGPSEIIEKAKNAYFEIHDLYLKLEQNVIREEFVLGAAIVYYPEIFMGYEILTKSCNKWDSQIIYTANYNRCNHKNALFHSEVRNNKMYLVPEQLDSWV